MQNNVNKRRLCAALLVASSVFFAVLGFSLSVFLSSERPVSAPDVIPKDISERSVDGALHIGSSFTVTEYTRSAFPGERVSLCIRAETDETLSIYVYYPSGKSTSAILEDERVAEGQTLKWGFNISSVTVADTLRIVVRGENGYATFNVTVAR